MTDSKPVAPVPGRPPPVRLAGYPQPLLAAAIVAIHNVSFLLVGSAALWLRGEDIPVADADLVIEPGDQNARRLHAALTELAVRPRLLPAPRSLHTLDIISVITSFGKVDCLLQRGRSDWPRLLGSAGPVHVADAQVRVASASDAWALRRRFKK
jgi:hypothetical protein